jgi:hypothetical protein
MQGMYRAALGILNTLRKKEIIKEAFERYQVEQCR